MIITQTPLRISFAGGGTDFPDYFNSSYGSVVSATIDKFLYVIVKKKFDKKICIGYSKQEVVSKVSDIKHELIREVMIYFNITSGIEIKTMSDIPSEGSGLGSSSALLVGVIKALSEYKGMSLTQKEIAKLACSIEVDTLKKPIGWQDQYSASYGGLNHYKFSNNEVEVTPITYPGVELNEGLMLFYTGITRQASSILQEQKDNIEYSKIKLDKIRNLSDTLKDNFSLHNLGYNIHEGWNIKTQLASGISNSNIDKMINDANTAGALGCKILGAGGGGFILVCCEPDKKNIIRQSLHYLEGLPFNFERYGSKVIFNIEQ